ncbi:MAG TPA: glutathione binding-like protein [Xanthobacteraceae bacterium]|nr:glutathione binding-like protein [Xanthobacteraceae bacterium]
MDLYFSPLACSMATRIALYEANTSVNFIEVDSRSKTLVGDGSNFYAINPLGLVPVLRTDDGDILYENAAILPYVADRIPGKLAGDGSLERSKVQQWLSFTGTELHKGLFTPLFSKTAPAEAKSYALKTAESRFDYLDAALTNRESLLDRFTIADAYLATILHWTSALPEIPLDRWPAVKAYLKNMRNRPSMSRALKEEIELYKIAQTRHQAA